MVSRDELMFRFVRAAHCGGRLVFVLTVAVGCSRTPPSSEAANARAAAEAANAPDAAPSSADSAGAVETTSASLRRAAEVGEANAGGAAGSDVVATPSLPSLAGKIVLHVGDSMVGGDRGLTRALEQRFTGEGAKFIHDYKVSESIVSYDHSPKLKGLLAKHRPDILILTLGTNDVFVPYPASMTANVQSIVKRIGPRECYWMGPPTWKPDTGIVAVLRDNVQPCKFFDASTLKLQRAGDGIHPTDRGGAEWADGFWAFFRSPTSADAGAL